MVAIYEFDQELRTRLSALLSQLEIALRFVIGHPLNHLGQSAVSNHLYGVLLILRYLILSVAPQDQGVHDLMKFITEHAQQLGFRLQQLGFPEGWENDELWDSNFALGSQAMKAAGLLDRARSFTKAQARAELTAAPVRPDSSATSPEQLLATSTEEEFCQAVGQANATDTFSI